MKAAVRLSWVIVVAAAALWFSGWDRRDRSYEPPVGAEASRHWTEADLWLAPPADPVEPSMAARGIALLGDDRPEEAIELLASVDDPAIGPYARLHLGRAWLELEQPDEAVRAARSVLETTPDGYPGEMALWLLADAHEAGESWREALETWQALALLPSGATATVQQRLAAAATKAGEPALARQAWSRIYYEWPASPEAREATTELARDPAVAAGEAVALELMRADRLYEARRWADAGRAYERVAARAAGADRQRIELNLGLIDGQLGRHAQALKRLAAYLDSAAAPDRDRAAFGMLAAWRGLGRSDYPARVDRFVADFPDSPLAETALNELATHYILADQDGRAADVFARMYERYPEGRHADRAAWRAGWWAYRHDDYRETIRFFESAATRMRRADYRPAWLYWTGRSYEALGQADTARTWYLRALADYRNSYYGRRAAESHRRLTGRDPAPAEIAAYHDPARAIVAGTAPPGSERVRPLLAASLWSDAVAELLPLQASRGDDPVVEATIAYALNRNGELRPAITAMRRAYPQFMSDGGEALPERILQIIFPVAHVDTIVRHASERRLDVHLVMALVAQESTFQADIRSSANAVGLMQLLPATGRRFASRAGITRYTPAVLTDPVANVRLGTTYLAELLRRYDGDEAAALAAYNAGEGRVDRWRAERPGVPRDEFVDDIPFPETQNYVKRILGTADDYRILYGAALLDAAVR